MFRSKRGLLVLTAVLLCMMVIAGCGATGQESAVTSNQLAAGEQGKTEQQNQENQAVGEQNSRVVEHAMGSTEIQGTPQRVVTLYQGANDAAILLGVKPVGAVESFVEQPWYKYIREQMDGVTNLGNETQPNLEEIHKLKPDLIIGAKSRHENIYEQLKAIAPTVIAEDKDNWKTTLSLVAKAANKVAEEEAFLAEWNQKVAHFKEQMGEKLSTEVSIVDFRADHARIFYAGFSGLVLEELGLSRPAQQQGEDWGVKLTSQETIPQMDGDVIFDLTSVDRDDGRLENRKKWTSHPLWKNLRAVQNGRVYQVDTVIWNNAGGPIAAMKMVDDVYRYFEVK
ncbi:iron-siderophore ABC transporter substrate-binding protein [Brevibacillus humidisoli]|uniref:ABC transporter substrate-binding protein n=1 Tax=Brevibacillus humidisoli TaxID=2895522 RepID=UPI001E60FF36|nr:iron-siderophore ABC transporter substrate-binding protein [Brevibacillus humidisoli]UFJ39454.1 iron-siderophore ABC transporter substrate-binding protein [Brevibacillus humidisoli]